MTIEEATEIVNTLPERDKLEQLAEEAAELSQAALKMIRAHGLSDNPTPITDEDAYSSLLEEVIDVLMLVDLLIGMDGLVEDARRGPKWVRWAQRIQTKKKEDWR